MIRQEMTYYKRTQQEKTYKEIVDGKIISFILYDKMGNILYKQESDGSWENWLFDKHNKECEYENSNGTWTKNYRDNKGRDLYGANSNGRWYRNEFIGPKVYMTSSSGDKIMTLEDKIGRLTHRHDFKTGIWHDITYTDGNKGYVISNEKPHVVNSIIYVPNEKNPWTGDVKFGGEIKI